MWYNHKQLYAPILDDLDLKISLKRIEIVKIHIFLICDLYLLVVTWHTKSPTDSFDQNIHEGSISQRPTNSIILRGKVLTT